MSEMPKGQRPWLASSEYGQKLSLPPRPHRLGFAFSKSAIQRGFEDLECNHLAVLMNAELIQIQAGQALMDELDQEEQRLLQQHRRDNQ